MMLPVILGVIFIVFTIMYLTPGDPARLILGENATQEAVEALREDLGLNDSYFVQLVRYVKNVVFKFDLGKSYNTGKPVLNELVERFPITLKLAFYSVFISTVLGITMGIVSATRQYSIFDKAATAISLVGVSMPNFWQGLMSVIFFSVMLGWLPASGSYGPKYWILPAITLGTSSAATIMRMTRSSLLEVIRQDYIRTARAKGQKESIVIWVHALKNALIPVVTVIGMQFGALLGGSILVESVFAIPGIGKYIIDAIKIRDNMIIQGGVLFLAISFSFVNLFVDILYGYIDPRIKSQYKTIKKGAAHSE